jgi:hypothetical protein
LVFCLFLTKAQAWCAQSNDGNQWTSVDLGERTRDRWNIHVASSVLM